MTLDKNQILGMNLGKTLIAKPASFDTFESGYGICKFNIGRLTISFQRLIV